MEKQVKKVTKKKTVAKEVKEEKVLKEKDTKKKKTEVKEVKKEKDTNKKNVKSTKKDVKSTKKDVKSKESFFKGVKNEMSKVVWPSKKNMIKYSIATIIFIVFFALYFFGIEVIMAWLKSFIVVM